MKGRVDKSMGIVTLIAAALSEINPTEPSGYVGWKGLKEK
jgi:hypothetical protein